MNDFTAHYTDEHQIMQEIRGSSLLEFFVDVFQAADRATRGEPTGFNALVNEWLDEFDTARLPVHISD